MANNQELRKKRMDIHKNAGLGLGSRESLARSVVGQGATRLPGVQPCQGRRRWIAAEQKRVDNLKIADTAGGNPDRLCRKLLESVAHGLAAL